MSRGKIMGLVFLLGLLILIFVFARSCHSGSEPQMELPPEGEADLSQAGDALPHHAVPFTFAPAV